MARRGMPVPCPVCRRETSVVRSTGQLWPHVHPDTRVPCAGSRQVIDLYGERRE